jgi:dolichol-phosphate mannosyltransferase
MEDSSSSERDASQHGETDRPLPWISVVVPIYNEEANLVELSDRVCKTLDEICSSRGYERNSYEIVLVDDGSRDGSWSVIQDLHAKDPRVKGLSFSRNFGHHIAVTAGIDVARGDVVVFMDGDLQDPPEEIPKLFDEYLKGFDIVYGIRGQRHDPPIKKATSRLFWWLLNRFSDVAIPSNQTMLRIMSRRAVDALKTLGEYSRFVHGLMAWIGFDVTTIEVSHAPRLKGTSKYNVAKMFRLAFHAITSFSTVPLRLATYVGLLASFTSLGLGVYFIILKIIRDFPVLGYASIIVTLFFFGGVQLMVCGIMGEYIGRIYREVQRRPLYIIKQSLT